MDWTYGWADWPADARNRDAYRARNVGGVRLLVPTFPSAVTYLGANGRRRLAATITVAGPDAPQVLRVDVHAELGTVDRGALRDLPADRLAVDALARSSLSRDARTSVVMARTWTTADVGGLQVIVGAGPVEQVQRRARPVLTDAHGVPWFRVEQVRDAARVVDRGKRRRLLTDDHLGAVAQVYLDAQADGRAPTAAVAAAFAAAPKTAERWVTAARAAGHLPPYEGPGER